MTEAMESVREELRLIMLRQHAEISGKRETYADGLFSGLVIAIERIDAALAVKP